MPACECCGTVVTLTPEEADDLEAVLQLGLDVYMDSARGPRLRALAARLAAAVRPAAGIVLTPEEAKAVRRALQHVAAQHRPYAQAFPLQVDEATADLLDGVADRLR